MKCEYCELRRVGPFVISKSCTILSGKLINKQTGEPLIICMHHKGERINERRTAEQ